MLIMGQSRCLSKIMAVEAVPTAKGACFGFSKVESSSGHEQAISWEMECRESQCLNQINK